MRAGVLTISDKGFAGERKDGSGPVICEILRSIGAVIEVTEIVPDEQDIISDRLIHCADTLSLDLVVTTGGTGVSPRDVTPEATKAAIEREVPGMGEAMRTESLKITPHAVISRGIAGIRGQTLIINLPGSPKAASENLKTILDALPHAISKIKGDQSDCAV
ncbi:MAG: MogA/MoaB family molybdenum cofactor biosynthesis protein [Deltaproteobacteria bacterium]|nr:MogA/MoaB family molybdenum cofactor biosynthesis protein [Deltaproteobacteria bacterium]